MSLVKVPPLRNVCIFCGSRKGNDPQFLTAARALGKQLVSEHIRLVYGGGTVGLMGEIAVTVDAAPNGPGVLGVIPKALMGQELSGQMIGECRVVEDMHSRKTMMAENADGFIAMPGGFGTFEEVLEIITWQQLGFHTKPIGFYNVGGFFDDLLKFFGHAVDQGFISPHHNTVIVSADPKDLLQKMRDFRAPPSLIHDRRSGKEPLGADVAHPSSGPDAPLSAGDEATTQDAASGQ